MKKIILKVYSYIALILFFPTIIFQFFNIRIFPAIYNIIIFFFCLPAAFIFWSKEIFQREYTIFGNKERRKFPYENCILKLKTYHAILHPFSVVHTPIVLYVFRSGLGINILFIWKVFIPWDEIKEINMKKTFYAIKYKITTVNKELKYPIIFYLNNKQNNIFEKSLKSIIDYSIIIRKDNNKK